MPRLNRKTGFLGLSAKPGSRIYVDILVDGPMGVLDKDIDTAKRQIGLSEDPSHTDSDMSLH